MSKQNPKEQDARTELDALETSPDSQRGDLPGDGELITPANFSPPDGSPKRSGFRLRPMHIALGGSLVALLLVVAFLFSARSVFIQVEPGAAELAIDGGLHLPVGDGYLMLGGDYDLALSAPGYQPLSETITVGEAQNQSFEFDLEKLPGHLTVLAEVGEAGEVWVDGERLGALNERLENIPAGEHQLQVVTERYKPFARQIEITGLDQHQQIEPTLEPAWAEVEFSSQPAGAQLTVDGEVVGTTPLTAEILEGEHRIAMQLPGHKSWERVLEVSAGEARTMDPVTLEAADGLVLIQSRPAQASITVDGNYYGLTPQEVALPPGQRYQLTLFKEGFQPAQQQLAVESGREQAVNVALEPRLGQIEIKTAPSDALLYVDGRLMGRANQTLSLPAHQARVTVSKEGYADYQTTVLPRPDFAQSLEVTLKTVEEAKWENIEPVITTAAGQTMKLFRPEVSFVMGSSRREQGRRANEAMHRVLLDRPFYLATREVTNREFRRFNPEHSSGHTKGESLNGENYPVVGVSWQQAALYSNWLSEQESLPPFYRVEEGVVTGFNPQASGYRLPTEAEWAWTARYRDGEMLKYPWGPQLPPDGEVVNIADRNAAALVGYVQPGYEDGYPATAPVGSFPANEKGIHDLAGNVAEWVNDFYEIPISLSDKAEENRLGPMEGSYHVIRGSSWAHGSVTELRLSFRDYSDEGRNDVGFRIARFVE